MDYGLVALRILASNITEGNGTDVFNNATSAPSVNSTEMGVTISCDQESQEVGLWWVGVILSIVASILGNLGVNTQKYSMTKEAIRDIQRKYVKQPIWILGLVSVVVGAVMDFAALGFAAQSLITPVGGFTMVANLIFAHFWLKETITWIDLFATLLIITGIVLVAAFADKREQCFTLEDLLLLYQRSEFIIYSITVGGLIVLDYLLIRHIRRIRNKHGVQSRQYLKYNKIQPVATAALSALFGAQSVLFAKSTIELFKISVEGDNQFFKLGTYAIVGSMLFTIAMQIHWLATGLQDFDATLIVPVFQSIYTIGAIVSGASYFNEFRFFSQIQLIMFPIGAILIVIGVQLLTLRQKRHSEDEMNVVESRRGTQLKHFSNTSMSTSGGSTSESETISRVNSRRQSVDVAGQYGAITGRYIPALMIWNELPDVSESFPELRLPVPSVPNLKMLRHPFSSSSATNNDTEFAAESRRRSLPALQSTEGAVVRARAGRIHKSFAHIESQLLSGIGGLTRSFSNSKKHKKHQDSDDEDGIVLEALEEGDLPEQPNEEGSDAGTASI